MGILDTMRLDGRRAVVTGGSRGLGLEIARALGEAGAEVIISSRDEPHLAEARQSLGATVEKVHTVVADLATPEGAERFCDDALSRFDPIEILVNNVGGRRVNYPTEEFPRS